MRSEEEEEPRVGALTCARAGADWVGDGDSEETGGKARTRAHTHSGREGHEKQQSRAIHKVTQTPNPKP